MTCRVHLSKSVILDLRSKAIMEDGFRCWISGESGAGKSSAAALIAAQVIEQKHQVVVLDLHGEYGDFWALDPANVVRIGYGERDPVSIESVPWCIDIIASGKSLLLDLSHWSDVDPEALDAFMLELMTELYALRKKRPRWTLVIVEEAAQIIPQNQSPGQAANIRIFLGMITGGRKYGLQFLLTSQRCSLVDINAISSCNVRLFLRISETKDWDRVRKYIPSTLKVDFNSTRMGMKFFPTGQAILLSRWTNDVKIQLLRGPVALKNHLVDLEEP